MRLTQSFNLPAHDQTITVEVDNDGHVDVMLWVEDSPPTELDPID